MINNKVGTQNFSKAAQSHDFHDEKWNYTAATPGDKDSSGKQQNVGDILNQVANPGGKDPNKQVRHGHNTLDKDDFLKLMLTQMKNQDPMNPMQSHEMAAQLAQFTSLEQLFNVNKNLEGLTKAQDPVQKYEALNFLGKSIKADTRQIMRGVGDTATDLRFNLGADSAKVKITISDELGNTVKTLEFGGLKKGPNKISWAGQNEKDQDVKPGKYIFNVEAQTSAGRKVAVQTQTAGTITGVNYTPEGPMLMVGDQKVRLADVEKIEDEGLKEKQNMQEQMRFLGPQGAQGAEGARQQGGQQGAQGAQSLGAGNAAVPEEVLRNLTSQLKARQNGGGAATDVSGGVGKYAGPQPIVHKQASEGNPYGIKVKPEDKPEAKLKGDVIPLEVASANETGSGHINNGIVNTGGAFGRK